jgi:hypothetical protein
LTVPPAEDAHFFVFTDDEDTWPSEDDRWVMMTVSPDLAYMEKLYNAEKAWYERRLEDLYNKTT